MFSSIGLIRLRIMIIENIGNLVPKAVLGVCRAIKDAGGRGWLVGGSARDLFLGNAPKDWDIEAYGLPPDLLTDVLNRIGRCDHVGKKFGVSKLWAEGYEIDVALPRTELKVARGHKGFDVTPDPFIEPVRAVLRRDFTINAMMFDPLNNEFVDFFTGVQDLKDGILRHVSGAFIEDPLRPLRAMQLAARYRLTLAEETEELCKSLLSEADTLPKSRVWQEWFKWSKAAFPSYGLNALKAMGWLTLYPELEKMVGCPQQQRWHPEGDVWTHTCLVVNEAARLGRLRGLSEQEQVVLMFAALCHDMGKPLATRNEASGEVVAPEHGHMGVGPAEAFLDEIFMPKHMRRFIPPLVSEHVAHFENDISEQAVMHLAKNIEPANIMLWEALTEADACGCYPLPPKRPGLQWLDLAKDIGVSRNKCEPIITGEMLLGYGWHQSPQLGKMLAKAYKAQLNGAFKDKLSAYSWLKKNAVATQEK